MIQPSSLHGTHYFFPQVWELLFQLGYQKLCVFAAGAAGGGALALDNRQFQPGGGVANIPFFTKHHRADHPQIPAGKITFRRETTQLPTIKKVHEKGLYRIVKMVPQGKGGAAVLFLHLVQNNPGASGRTGCTGFPLCVLQK